jgi:hypothetical protein
MSASEPIQMPTNVDLPFQPIRNHLYSSRELMTGFDPAIPPRQ